MDAVAEALEAEGVRGGRASRRPRAPALRAAGWRALRPFGRSTPPTP